jgi:hypothetical protein
MASANPSEALAKWREENPDHESSPRNPYQRWMDQDTRKSAIAAMCWTCMGGKETEGEGVRASIKGCTSDGLGGATRCPLYDWRPYR